MNKEPFMDHKIHILYEDRHLVLVNKPLGLLSQSQSSSQRIDSVENFLRKKLAKNKQDQAFVHAAHRLDKVTSGVLLFAKSSKALRRLNEMMKNKAYEKTYLALAYSHNPLPLHRQETALDFLEKTSHRSVISSQKRGKKSVLHYKVLAQENKLALIEIHLETGRYHQIRVQLSSRGIFILGDEKYSTKVKQAPCFHLCPFYPEGIALHHYRFSFTHPVLENADAKTRKKIDLQANPCLNPYFQAYESLLQKLQLLSEF